MCLPEFLNPIPPTTAQRAKMALDVLTHHALMDDEDITEDQAQDFTWDSKK
jgi:Holliday junction resolvase RusA-like endonuclease